MYQPAQSDNIFQKVGTPIAYESKKSKVWKMIAAETH